MQVRALKTFKSEYGKIHSGNVFNAEPSYAKKLQRNGLVEIVDAAEPGPSDDRSKGDAPSRSGKGSGAKGPTPGDTVPPLEGGPGITSASLPAGPASPRKTLPSSKTGARTGVKTPRKPKAKTSSTRGDG